MPADARQLVVDYLTEQKLMQLATVGENGPWACNVWQAFDDDLNIYFFSSTTRRHSQDIEKDNRVAGVIAKPHELSDKPRAIQFSGVARKLTKSDDIVKARSVYEERIFDATAIDKFMADPDQPHMFYRITPNKLLLLDTVNFPDNPRQLLIS